MHRLGTLRAAFLALPILLAASGAAAREEGLPEAAFEAAGAADPDTAAHAVDHLVVAAEPGDLERRISDARSTSRLRAGLLSALEGVRVASAMRSFGSDDPRFWILFEAAGASWSPDRQDALLARAWLDRAARRTAWERYHRIRAEITALIEDPSAGDEAWEEWKGDPRAAGILAGHLAYGPWLGFRGYPDSHQAIRQGGAARGAAFVGLAALDPLLLLHVRGPSPSVQGHAIATLQQLRGVDPASAGEGSLEARAARCEAGPLSPEPDRLVAAYAILAHHAAWAEAAWRAGSDLLMPIDGAPPPSERPLELIRAWGIDVDDQEGLGRLRRAVGARLPR